MRERAVPAHQLQAESSLDHRETVRDGEYRLERETVPAQSEVWDPRPHERATISAAGRQRLGSAVRIGLGLIWLIDAYFKWQPSFLSGLVSMVHDGAAGQPAWLMPWFHLVRAILAVQPVLSAYAVAMVETGIALALVLGIARKVAYLGGAAWSLLIWTTAEGFGRTPSGEVATDIGTGIAYAAVFLALLAADQCAGTRSLSLDTALERRVPWWRRIAEVRR